MTTHKSDRRSSVDYWYKVVAGKMGLDETLPRLISALLEEVPNMISTTMERSCNLQCTHCIYQAEKPTSAGTDQYNISDIVTNVVRQLPRAEDGPHHVAPKLLHDGRILQRWHLGVLRRAKEIRPDLRVGLIDNGTYVRLLSGWGGFKLDWLDISVDGTESSHNLQRNSQTAYQKAIEGLRSARKVVLPAGDGGRVTSLMTATSLNYSDVKQVAETLFGDNLVDEIHITPMSPAREENQQIEISAAEMGLLWRDVVTSTLNYGENKVIFRIYRIEDLEKLISVVGRKVFRGALESLQVVPETASVVLNVASSVPIYYYPLSLWPQETFLVDADGVNRLAYSLKYTLAELVSGRSVFGEDTTRYSTEKLSGQSSLKKVYTKVVHQWWEHFGNKYLAKEIKVLGQVLGEVVA